MWWHPHYDDEPEHSYLRDLVQRAAERPPPYRSHLAFVDLVADAYDANDFALRRMVETIKDALDPRGILAPGKQGIWPAGRRP